MQRQYKKYILLFWGVMDVIAIPHICSTRLVMVVSLFIPISFIHFLYLRISVLKAVFTLMQSPLLRYK